MTGPIAPGRPLPSSPPFEQSGVKMATPEFTPGHRLPNIDKSKIDPEELKAANAMEGMFLDYMMKVMRNSVPKNEMDGSSPATDLYQGMLDSEFAQKAVHAGGVGLSDQIIAYLESQRYNLPRGQMTARAPTAPPEAGTGGTHEGQPVRK